MVSEVVSTAHCAWIDARVKELEKKLQSMVHCSRVGDLLIEAVKAGGDSMAELKMGEFGVSRYGEAIYIASSVLYPSIWLGPR